MTYKWNDDYNRFSIASDILLQIVDSIYAVNNEIEFGVRAYGTEYPSQLKNCTDSRLIVPFNLQNANQIKQSLLHTTPIGWSPIAYSLRQAASNEMNNTNDYDYSIIFITDGGESCGGDICQTFSDLLKNKISITPYIIGLDNNSNLKTYYNCLGKYVAVQDVNDIPKAVKLIVDENRPILNKKKNLNLKTVFSNTPIKNSKPKVVKPRVVEPKEIVKRNTIGLQVLNPFSGKVESNLLPAPSPLTLSPLYRVLEYTFTFDMTPPVKRLTTNLSRISPLTSMLAKAQPAAVKPLRVKPLYNKLEYTFNFEKPEPPVQKVTEKLTALRPFEPRHRLVYAFRVPRPIYVPPLYKKLEYTFNYTTPVQKVVKTTPKPKTIIPPPGTVKNDGKVKVSREIIPHNETLVQVYFVNKYQKKKMYRNATPTIVMQDATSKKEVKRFIRSVTRGEPDMKLIDPGSYSFTVKGDNSLTTAGVRIDKNSINKIFIEVTDGTLQFVYANNPGRPVKEFQAIVNPRFENKDKTVVQECKELLYYSPGTYYIQINTLPPLKFAMYDISFAATHIVQLPEPGFVQINNSNRLGTIHFTRELNDADSRFHVMTINGNVIDQKEMMRPGTYKVHFDKVPGTPQAGRKQLKFKVVSNKTTQLILQ